MNTLAEILTSKVRAEIFRILFGLEQRELHLRGIERQSGFAMPTVRRDLNKLETLDLVKTRRDSNRLYYTANKDHPLYQDIKRLVLKTNGLVDILRSHLEKSEKIRISFIFGSIARQETNPESDVDLFIIGDLTLREVTTLLSGAAERIGREINPVLMTMEEYSGRMEARDHFISRVAESQKLFIIGCEDELG